jgi:glycosyltransferase involved in cell wall biosynthesis
LRVALILDPLSIYMEDPLALRVKWGAHASILARELLGRGHAVRGFGAPPGLIPRSSEAADAEPPGGGLAPLKRFRPDVVLAYDALSPAAVRGARAAKKLGAGLVLIESALPSAGRIHERALRRIGELLWGPYLRRAAHVIVALDGVARDELTRRGFPHERIEIVPHGVDLHTHRPGLSSTLVARNHVRGRILLYVGRLEHDRGVDILINAFSRTVGQRGDWNLVLAGEGSQRSSLRAMADRLGAADRVHFIGRPREEELPGLLGAATLLAVPARSASTLGRTIGKALACGVPVLVADQQRLQEHVQHDVSGLVVPSGDVECWTEALRLAAAAPVKRKRWSENALRVAREELAWESVAGRLETLLLRARDRARGTSASSQPEPAAQAPSAVGKAG